MDRFGRWSHQTDKGAVTRRRRRSFPPLAFPQLRQHSHCRGEPHVHPQRTTRPSTQSCASSTAGYFHSYFSPPGLCSSSRLPPELLPPRIHDIGFTRRERHCSVAIVGIACSQERIRHGPDNQTSRARERTCSQLRVSSGASRRARAGADGHQSGRRREKAVPGEPAQPPGADRTGATRHQRRNRCLPSSRRQNSLVLRAHSSCRRTRRDAAHPQRARGRTAGGPALFTTSTTSISMAPSTLEARPSFKVSRTPRSES